MPSNSVRRGRVPAEFISVGGGVAAALGVVAVGAGLSAALPEPSPWLTASAYLAPASLAFAAYWWMAQKL
jgi:hypothetical protein